MLGEVFHWAHESFSFLPSTGSRGCLRILLHTPPHSSTKQGSELVLHINSHSSCQSHWQGFTQLSINFHIPPFDFPTLFLPCFRNCRDDRSMKEMFSKHSRVGAETPPRDPVDRRVEREQVGLKWEGSEDKGRQAQTTAKPAHNYHNSRIYINILQCCGLSLDHLKSPLVIHTHYSCAS